MKSLVWQPVLMRLSDAARLAWSPSALVTGLLLVGLAVHTDHLFEPIGGSLERLPGGSTVLFVTSALAVAVVTAASNLDTAVVFLKLRAAYARL